MVAEKRLVILKRANKFFKHGKIDAAIKEYKKILDIKPNDLEIRRIIGDLELKQNNVVDAISQFEWIADYYLKEGFFAKAIAMYKRITRIDPNYEEASFKLAELYSKQGLIIEAKQIYLDIAEEYKRQNDKKKALDIYKKILEFDRNNIKMRLLLADNYLREGLQDNALDEYLIASDILLKKKNFQKAEEVLLDTLKKSKDTRLIEKLVDCYKAQGDDDKAIKFLSDLGSDLSKDVGLLKVLGELFFRKKQMDDAEDVFKRIVEVDPEETEVIMKLGKVYLQRGEYDRTFELFLPIIEKNMNEEKYEEASSFLRFIIASNNSYFPALTKLASIFKASGKKNNLIALFESLIPIYEKKEMFDELKETLEELVELSDSPFTYEEYLSRITGKEKLEKEEEEANEKEKEFLEFNMRVVDEALRVSDYDKAIEIMKKCKEAFPDNIDIRVKLFDVYQLRDDTTLSIEEGKALLELYKTEKREEEYKELLDKLSILKPEDEKLVELHRDEATNIEIDFDQSELDEQMDEISSSKVKEIDLKESSGSDDVLILSDNESVPEPQYQTEKLSKSFTSSLSEIDFYINDGYFDDAEKLIDELKNKYPKNEELLLRVENLEKAKVDVSGDDHSSTATDARRDGIEIEPLTTSDSDEDEIEIEASITDEHHMVQENEDSRADIDVGDLNKQPDIKVGDKEFSNLDKAFEIEMENPEDADELQIDEIDREQIVQSPSPEPKEKSDESHLSVSDEIIDLDNIMLEEDRPSNLKAPFKEMEQQDVPFEEDEEILKDDVLFPEDEAYFEVEKNIQDELESIGFWLKELEKERTSTTERNMMEIFDEFKKGVEEKIGQEDYDTRYNLGIAYKEMGLLEEAIHEFLISSNHPHKFFDSAGLLGLCFREKGMNDEAISWFERALESPDRKEEEYLALKYELVITYRLKEDYTAAIKIIEEINEVNPDYRDVSELHDDIKGKIDQ